MNLVDKVAPEGWYVPQRNAFRKVIEDKNNNWHDLILRVWDLDPGVRNSFFKNFIVNASLSGGEIKRIEIATVMARKTKLSIFDEPEAGIDLWSFNNLIDVFRSMRQENNGTIIIISHQERILDIADEIIVLADGRISDRGSKEEILPKLLHEDCRFSLSGKSETNIQ